MAGIYGIRCIINNKIYVGQTSKDFKCRFYGHRYSLRTGQGVPKLQVDWDMYGEDAFEFIILEEVEDKSIRNEKEKFYIAKYNSTVTGYNSSTGGLGQGNFKELNGMYHKYHTQQSLELMSEHRKGLTVGDKNPMYGKHHTNETKLKISQKNKGRMQSKEERSMRCQSMRKANLKPEVCKSRKKAGLKRRLYTNDLVLKLRQAYLLCGSVKQVAIAYNLNYERCRQAIKGDGIYSEIVDGVIIQEKG